MTKIKTSNVKIVGAIGRGYFLTIRDSDFPMLENTWAVTDKELRELYELLRKKYETA